MDLDWLPPELRRFARPDAPLAEATTFRIGGKTVLRVDLERPEDVAAFARAAAENGIAWRLLGGGSNVLVSDAGLNEAVVVFRSGEEFIRVEGETLSCSGGAELDRAAEVAARAGLSGLVFATGIPGTVGGACYGNAGAFGEDVGGVLESARICDRTGREDTLSASELGFSYRYSRLKETGWIVLQARFRLQTGDRRALLDRMEEIRAFRRERHPDWRREPCAGSFFKNLAPTSAAGRRQAAGAVLDRAGAKKLREGGAFVYPKHANIIVSDGRASFSDVVELAARMRRLALEREGVELFREVMIWPEDAAPELPSD